MSATKVLEIMSELDVHLTITKNGIGVTASSLQDVEASFSEYTWAEIISDLVDSHSVPVLGTHDEKISAESYDHLRECSNKMRSAANILTERLDNMNVIRPVN